LSAPVGADVKPFAGGSTDELTFGPRRGARLFDPPPELGSKSRPVVIATSGDHGYESARRDLRHPRGRARDVPSLPPVGTAIGPRPHADVLRRTGPRSHQTRPGYLKDNPKGGLSMLLILAGILLVIAIAGGVIVHPLLFVLAIVAIALFFSHRRGAAL
jgi:hypothetical protein